MKWKDLTMDGKNAVLSFGLTFALVVIAMVLFTCRQ